MTGGMAFVYDPKNKFENYVNPQTVVWQIPETDYWKDYLKSNLIEFAKDTSSKTAQKLIDNYDKEIKNFKQVCPKEMLDKLKNPITLKNLRSKSA